MLTSVAIHLALLLGAAAPPQTPARFTLLAVAPPASLSPAPAARLAHALRKPPPPARSTRPASLSFLPGETVSSRQDAWLGEDKYRHFFMSFAGTLFTYGAARAVVDEASARAVALGAGAVAGIGKEFYDRGRGRSLSPRDFAWDAMGLLAGWAVVSNTR